jgi:hypothetical protein
MPGLREQFGSSLIYWQLFTTEHTDLNALIRAHTGDPKLKMYSVDFDREYPDPSNQELQIAALSEILVEAEYDSNVEDAQT